MSSFLLVLVLFCGPAQILSREIARNADPQVPPCGFRSQGNVANQRETARIAIEDDRDKTKRYIVPKDIVADEPKVNVVEEPNVNFADQPNVNIAEQSNVNVAEQSNVNVAEQPNVNVVEQPNVDFDEQPNVDFDVQPNVDFAEQPNVNFAEEPNVNEAISADDNFAQVFAPVTSDRRPQGGASSAPQQVNGGGSVGNMANALGGSQTGIIHPANMHGIVRYKPGVNNNPGNMYGIKGYQPVVNNNPGNMYGIKGYQPVVNNNPASMYGNKGYQPVVNTNPANMYGNKGYQPGDNRNPVNMHGIKGYQPGDNRNPVNMYGIKGYQPGDNRNPINMYGIKGDQLAVNINSGNTVHQISPDDLIPGLEPSSVTFPVVGDSGLQASLGGSTRPDAGLIVTQSDAFTEAVSQDLARLCLALLTPRSRRRRDVTDAKAEVEVQVNVSLVRSPLPGAVGVARCRAVRRSRDDPPIDIRTSQDRRAL